MAEPMTEAEAREATRSIRDGLEAEVDRFFEMSMEDQRTYIRDVLVDALMTRLLTGRGTV